MFTIFWLWQLVNSHGYPAVHTIDWLAVTEFRLLQYLKPNAGTIMSSPFYFIPHLETNPHKPNDGHVKIIPKIHQEWIF
jgi:hypothetical protein